MSNPGSTAKIDPGHVTVGVAQGVATLEFGHPRSNSMPGALLTRLAETITTAGANPEVAVLVLRSAGTAAFCAGASFDELKAIGTLDEGKQFFSGFAKVILAMIRCPKFVVVRVHGRAAGGGVGLIAAADYAIATAESSVKLSELAVGIGPFVVGPVIERKIGHGAFQAMSVDADWRSAAWAANQGLYAEVRETAVGLEEAVATRVGWLAGRNPAAMAQLKRVFWEGTEQWDQLLQERAAMSGSLILTPAAKAAVNAGGR